MKSKLKDVAQQNLRKKKKKKLTSDVKMRELMSSRVSIAIFRS